MSIGKFWVGWVGSKVQFKGLPDGAKRILNRANSDLMSSSSMPFTDILGKTDKDCNLLFCFNSSEKGVHIMLGVAEVGPVSPISQADSLSLSHDPAGDCFPCKIVKTSELSFV